MAPVHIFIIPTIPPLSGSGSKQKSEVETVPDQINVVFIVRGVYIIARTTVGTTTTQGYNGHTDNPNIRHHSHRCYRNE